MKNCSQNYENYRYSGCNSLTYALHADGEALASPSFQPSLPRAAGVLLLLQLFSASGGGQEQPGMVQG
jgi:hypothetical protein